MRRRHNPVGKVLSKEELQAIGDLCVKYNVLILSDEVRCSFNVSLHFLRMHDLQRQPSSQLN